jgi:hypothetical protein
MQNIVPRRASISQGASSVAKSSLFSVILCSAKCDAVVMIFCLFNVAVTDEAIQERLATISSELPSDSPTFWATVNKCVNVLTFLLITRSVGVVLVDFRMLIFCLVFQGAEVSGARFSEQIKFLKSIYPPGIPPINQLFTVSFGFFESLLTAAAQNPPEPIVQGFDSFRAFVSQSGSGGGFEFLGMPVDLEIFYLPYGFSLFLSRTVNELSQCTLSQQASAAKSHAIINSYMQSFFEGELRQLKVKQEQYTSGEQQYLHDARKLFMLRQDSDPASLQKYAQVRSTWSHFAIVSVFHFSVLNPSPGHGNQETVFGFAEV